MQQEELRAVFDRMAETYDQQWARLSPINEALHLLIGSVLASLPQRSRILCVGAGTGAELLALARRFPDAAFTAVDPSAAMLEVCRAHLQEAGIEERCHLHAGYLESLPETEAFDAATSLLVSQFILDKAERSSFFSRIAARLKPGGILLSSDLSADTKAPTYQALLEIWLRTMRQGGVPPDALEKMRESYAKDVGVLPEQEVAKLIEAGGFAPPLHIFQVGLIHAWCAEKPPAA